MSSAFKNLTHKMFLDTTFNSVYTVLSTIYKNFLESAMKYYRYAKCMATGKYLHAALLIGTHFLMICTAVLLELLYDYRLPNYRLTLAISVRYHSGCGRPSFCTR